MSLHPAVLLGFYVACIVAGGCVFYLIDRMTARDPMQKFLQRTKRHPCVGVRDPKTGEKHAVMRIARNGIGTYTVRQIPKNSAEELLQETLGSDTLHRIFAAVANNSKIRKKEIQRRTGLSRYRVFWSLSRLGMFGAVVEKDSAGKRTYRAADAFVKAYETYQE